MKRFAATLLLYSLLVLVSNSAQASGGTQPGGAAVYYSENPIERYGFELLWGNDYPESILSGFGGVFFLIGHEYDRQLSGEFEMIIRAALPTPVSPFVGMGGALGYSSQKIDEENSDTDFFASLNPEIGVNFWITDYFRLTVNARYYITTAGRDKDFWAYGIGFGLR